jgi:hypothetical protein
MSTTPNDPTLEALTARVAALEQAVAAESRLPRKSGPCTCSSDEATVPAVRAIGSYSAHGVDTSSDLGIGLYATSDSDAAVYGQSTSNVGVVGYSPSNVGVNGRSDSGVGVRGVSKSSSGVFGESPSGYGVRGVSGSGYGVYGVSTSDIGVYGSSVSSSGVHGQSGTGAGVRGYSTSDIGVHGESPSGYGVYGSSVSSYGVYGQSTHGHAGWFDGTVVVNGLLVKNGGGFQIDHPLDAAHKYLSHSFVESPDMKNLYDGLVTLDANGQAEVRLPDWFETLNTDVRYQLTCLGGYAPVYIAEKLQHHRFTIAGGQAGMEVCWQVTGIRQDRWANAHRITVEQDKPAKEQGYYLHPDLHGEPEEKSILHARYPDLQRPLPPQK